MNRPVLAGVYLALLAIIPAAAHGQTTFTWNNALGGAYETSSNWTPAGPPSLATHIAAFNINGTYPVTLGANHSVGTVLLTAGTVNFSAPGRTLSVASNWQENGNVNWNTGTLSVGAGGSFNLVGQFSAGTGAFVAADQLFVGQGTLGVLTFTGATLDATGVLPQYIGLNVGFTAGNAALSLTNNSVGTINGGLAVIQPGGSARAQLSVTSGSDLTVGTLAIGQTFNFTSFNLATATLSDPGSTIVQTSGAGVEVGGGSLMVVSQAPATVTRSGVLTVDNAGHFVSGAGGLIDVNAGALMVNNGTFDANGDLQLINAGLCQVGAGGTLTIAPNHTLTVVGASTISTQFFQLQAVPAFSSSGRVSGGTLIVRSTSSFFGNLAGSAAFGGTANFSNVLIADAGSLQSQLQVTGAFSAGTIISGAGATSTFGDLLVQNGSVTATQLTAGGSSPGDIAMQGGSVNATSLSVGGGSVGTFLASSGACAVNTNTARIGDGSAGTGLFLAGFTSSLNWTNTNSIVVGAAGAGTLNLAGSASTTSTVNTAALVVGGEQLFSAGVGTVILGPGTMTLSASSTVIGNYSAGTVILSGNGRLASTTGDITLAANLQSSGYLLIGGGTTTVDGALDATGHTLTLGANGPATLDLRAHGSASVGTMLVGTSSGFFAGTGTALISGGSFTIGSAAVVGSGLLAGPGTLNVSGGSTGGAGLINVNNNGVLLLSAGSIANAVNNAGAATISGGVDIGAFTNIRTVTLGGGTMSGIVTNNATFNCAGGVISGTLNNNARLNLLAQLPPGTNVINNNAAGLIVPSGPAIGGAGTINNFGSFAGTGTFLAGTTLNNNGSFAASGGELDIAPGATFSNGSAGLMRNAPLSTLRVLTTAFTNSGSIEVNAGGGVQLGANLTIAAGKQLSMKGGVLAVTGSTIVNASGTLEGYGQLDTNLTNSGLTIFNGATNVQGNLVNNTGATVAVRNANTIVYGTVTNNGTITGSNGTIVFEGGFGPPPAPPSLGAATLDAGVDGSSGIISIGAGGRLISDYVRQGTLALAGTDVDPALALLRTRSDGGTVSLVNTLSIGTLTGGAYTGRLDLADTGIILDYTDVATPIAAAQAELLSGYSAGAWTGNGITSSAAAATASSAHKTALGYAESSDLGIGTFEGQAVDSTAVLTRYTYSGDSNLDGKVDLTDFTYLAANFNGSNKTWLQGDYNYDGKVDLTDFTFLASNFNQTLPAPGAIGAAAPEPSAVASITTIFALWASRRRRR